MDDFNTKVIGQRIRQLRQSKGKSQMELGRHLGRTHAAVSDIELGKTNLTVQDLSKIAAFLGVSVNDVLQESLPVPKEHTYHRFAKGVTHEEEREAQSSIDDFIKRARGLGTQDDK